MDKRYSRRRDDGVVEYSDSLDELEASAIREEKEERRGKFALLGLVVGAAVTYGLLRHYVPDWPKGVRFITLLGGAISAAVIFARLATALHMLLVFVIALIALSLVGRLIWAIL